MPKGAYAAASAMFTEQFAMDVVSENLANAKSAGFRRSVVVHRGFDEIMAERQGRTGDIKANGGAGIATSGSWRSFKQGEMLQTSAPFDMAINGPGFFLVRDENGEDLLTRNGSFGLDEAGRVVTSEGWQVQGQGGSITVPAEVRSVIVDRDGRFYGEIVNAEGAQQVFLDQLRLVDVEEDQRQSMILRSGQYFEPGDLQLQDLANNETQIEQGFLENSNVDSIGELVRMVALQRRYDAAKAALSRQLRNDSFSSILRGS